MPTQKRRAFSLPINAPSCKKIQAFYKRKLLLALFIRLRPKSCQKKYIDDNNKKTITSLDRREAGYFAVKLFMSGKKLDLIFPLWFFLALYAQGQKFDNISMTHAVKNRSYTFHEKSTGTGG